jgi:hypothetical protein
MTKDELRGLAGRLEGDGPLDAAAQAKVVALIGAAFPDRPVWRSAQAAALFSTDGALDLLAEALPSWSVHITGHSATVTGRWTCTIRETGVRDDDELIGVGKAGTLANAVAAALLKIIELRARAE